MSKGFRRRLMFGAGAALSGVALVGVMHLPIARPILELFAGLCPVNSVSADDVEALQQTASSALRGTAPVPSRDTLGLQLLLGGRGRVDAWRRASDSRCEQFTRGFAYVDCEPIDTDAGERRMIVSLDRAGQTRSVDFISPSASSAQSAAQAERIARELARRFGAPHEAAGEFFAAYLQLPFRSASASYRFSDALVMVRATNIPGSGVLVEESYVSPGAPASSMAALAQ